MKQKFTIVNSYEEEIDFGSDPCGYYIELNGKEIVEYGDDYHENGHACCGAFVKGYVQAKDWTKKQYQITHEDRADFEI